MDITPTPLLDGDGRRHGAGCPGSRSQLRVERVFSCLSIEAKPPPAFGR